MERQPKVVNTLEDLVKLATTSSKWFNAVRWNLGDRRNWQWVDPQDGRVYHAVDWNAPSGPDRLFQHTEGDKNDYVTVNKRQSELIELQEEEWLLEPDHSVSGYQREYIWLSADFGSKLDAAWPKDHKYGSTYRANRYYTLAGICRMLGRKGLDKELEQMFALAQAAEEKRIRNANRKNAARKLDIMEHGEGGYDHGLDDIAKYIPVGTVDHIRELLQLAREQIEAQIEE